ncbi:MAG: rhomboid family intramembrane serine protease [Nanoarchaeota archaeon]
MKSVFWLALICIIAFILQSIIPQSTNAFLLNENSFHQPYRFITSIFLHGDILHLAYNLFALLLFGFILERYIGTKKFLAVFFISGITANLIAVNFYSQSLGASGAIFGVIGALTVIKPFLIVWAFALPMPLILASILWAAGDIFRTFTNSNIGTIAHLSGIIFGIIFGFLFRKKHKENKRTRLHIPETYFKDWEDKWMLK